MSVRSHARFGLSFFTAALLPAVSLAVVAAASPAAAQPSPRCPASAADEAAAVRAAAGCHGRVEALSGLDEHVRVFANPSGALTAEISAVAQRVRADGRWVKPDPTLRRDVRGRIVPAATALRISFSGGGRGPIATIGSGAAELALSWPTALPQPKLSGAEATYPEVLPGVDLVLTAQAEGFAEVLVVKTPGAAANPALAAVRFGTTAKGLRLRQDAAGTLTAVDDRGATLFGSGTPAMWDSAQPAGDGPRRPSRLAVPGATRAAMPLQLDGADLVVHPDLAMLRSKATKFPVYIDPAIGRTSWTMINSRYPSQSYWSFDRNDCPDPFASIQCAKVGYTDEPTGMIYRSLFSFGISGLLHKHIQDAKLSMDTVYSWTNDDYATEVRITGGISSGTTWSNNASSWGAAVTSAKSHAHDRVRRRTEWGVTGAVQKAAGGTSSTLTLGLRAANESSVYYWKKFDAGKALLTVTYNSYPNAPDQLTVGGLPCVQGAGQPYLRTRTPTLKARLTDPDGTVRLLKGTFYWWKTAGGSRNSTDSLAQGSIVAGQSATVTIPAAKQLTDGATYAVQAITSDGIDSGQYSTTCEFQVDVTAPDAPSAVTSTDYPNDGQVHGGVGTAGTFVLKPPATVPADFYGYAYTLDPGVSAAAATQVAASGTDHTATISITPVADQTYNLRVWARDKAGNVSTEYVYQFSVRAGTGPDARWTFDGQDGADYSGHGNTLAATGGTWTAGRGSFGKAFLCNGTSAYAATSGPVVTKDPNTGATINLHSNKSFTVAATVRLDASTGSGQRAIVAQDGEHTSPFLLSYSLAEKKWRFAVAATDVDSPATTAVLSNATATVGVWTRLFAVYDGNTHGLRLYVNGVLQTATATAATFDATKGVTVGRMLSAGQPAGFFPGAIDDVRIYGRVVGSAEHEFALVGMPNPPLVTFPAGTSAYAGKPVQVVISAGGDTAVTKVKYQLGASGTATTVTLPAAGGQTTVNVTSTTVDQPLLMVQGIDTAGSASPIASAALDFREAPALRGRVTDATTGAALSGMTVVLTPGDLTRTTDATGSYSFTGMDAGTYTVTGTDGAVGCAARIATSEVDIDHGLTIDLNIASQADVFGYSCSVAPNTPFIPGTTKLDFSGIDAVSDPLTLPFPMPYYGKTYDTFWVSSSGLLAFVDPHGRVDMESWSLPDRKNAPLAAVAPFWDYFDLDDSAGVWTATVGSGADLRFVVEWRDVVTWDGAPVTFEAILSADGDITFNYTGPSDDPSEGEYAAVGITSPGGTYGLQYLYAEPRLRSNAAVTFAYPDDPWPINTYTVSGTVSHDGVPVPGATVSTDNRTTMADAAGHYEFDEVETGAYELRAEGGCKSVIDVDVVVDGDVTRDLPIATYTNGLGYHCAVTSEDWIPGEDEFRYDSSDAVLALPFPLTIDGYPYREAFVTAGVGLDLQRDGDEHHLAAELEVDSGYSVVMLTDTSKVLTAVTGEAPNRKFVIEMRDVALEYDWDTTLTYEMIINEDGTFSVLYKRLPDRSLARGDVTVTFEAGDLDDDIRFLDSAGYGARAGRSVTFFPPST